MQNKGVRIIIITIIIVIALADLINRTYNNEIRNYISKISYINMDKKGSSEVKKYIDTNSDINPHQKSSEKFFVSLPAYTYQKTYKTDYPYNFYWKVENRSWIEIGEGVNFFPAWTKVHLEVIDPEANKIAGIMFSGLSATLRKKSVAFDEVLGMWYSKNNPKKYKLRIIFYENSRDQDEIRCIWYNECIWNGFPSTANILAENIHEISIYSEQ